MVSNTRLPVESCIGQVNSAGCGYLCLRAGAGTGTPLRVGAGLTCCGAGRVRVVLGVGRAWVEKFFVRVNEC